MRHRRSLVSAALMGALVLASCSSASSSGTPAPQSSAAANSTAPTEPVTSEAPSTTGPVTTTTEASAPTCVPPSTTTPVEAAPVGETARDWDITSFDGTTIRAHWFPVKDLADDQTAPTILMGPGWGSPGDTNEDNV